MTGESNANHATARPDPRALPAPRFDVPLLLFYVLTFAGAWALWLASGVLSRPSPRQVYDQSWLVAQLGVFVPALAAFAVSAFSGPRFRRSGALTLVAVFVPATVLAAWIARTAAGSIPGIGWPRTLVVVAAGIAVMAFFSPRNRRVVNPGSEAPVGPVRAAWVLGATLYPLAAFLLAWLLVGGPARGPLATVLSGDGTASLWTALVLWCFNLVFGGSLGEESGWRGFALPRLLRRHGPIAASSLLAVAWALWHAPIDLTYGFGLQGPGALVARFLWTWPGTVIFTFFFLRARGSLLAPLALHTSFNVLSDIGAAAFEPAMQMLSVVNVAVAVPLALRLGRPPYWPLDVPAARDSG
jgi:membrane protease YdiL (CAAX protease family)